MAFWALFAIAVFYNLNIEQINFETTFFHRIIDQLFFVQVLKGYEDQ